ncbi:hypothetical protein ACHAWF_006339, partial [Thalassiosira exigua]
SKAIPPSSNWRDGLPSWLDLYCQEFDRPDLAYSFTQQASADTCLFLVLKSGYLSAHGKPQLYKGTNPLVQQLDVMQQRLATYNFRWIRNMNKTWKDQKCINKEKAWAMMACLFHYNLDVSLLMIYLGNNYTAAHRNVQETAKRLEPHVEPYLIDLYIRLMTVGCPTHFVAESSRENSVRYWRAGNNPSIPKKLGQVLDTMNKEDKNNFRFIPHLHFIPHHLLEKEGNKDCLITDAKMRHDAECISANMFGDVLTRLLTRIWNLRISYPLRDIIIITHANDVKSCFQQLKHHPDVMGACSYILGHYLFLQCGLRFGSDFSPANWEVLRRIAEQLATSLFKDKSLRTKHREYLDRLHGKSDLGKHNASFTPAKACSQNKGVFDENRVSEDTPHTFYVDDDLYAEIYDRERIEQAIAVSIEAIFILLGDSDLIFRQDPVSFDKLEEMMVNYMNLDCQHKDNDMTVQTPLDYIASTANTQEKHWQKKMNSCKLKEIETLAGCLGHIANTAPWLRFLMAHVYTSIARALKVSTSILITTNKGFRDMIKTIKAAPASAKTTGSKLTQSKMELSYAQSTTVK